MAKKKVVRRKKVTPGSKGPSPVETLVEPAGPLAELSTVVRDDGGAVLGSYRDPFGGHEVMVAALPIGQVEPTPYQRDASEPHVKRLMTVIEKIGLFLDPIIAVRQDGRYWTPNGNHRLQAMKRLGAKTVVALVVPDPAVAFKILALNTEKAHNLREKSLEALRMARELGRGSDGAERDFAFELEEPSYLTLGFCYEDRPRYSGGAYQPILRRVEDFLDEPLARSLPKRRARAAKLLALDDRVAEVVERLKAKGLKSPYLKPFVVARLNPIRFSKATEFDFDEVFEKMLASAGRFNADKVKQEDVARAGGGADSEE